MDARAWIAVGQDRVGGVARCANRSDGEPLLKQAIPVDALRVVLEDPVLMDIMGKRDLGTFVMASPAQHGDVHYRSRRERVGVGANLVVAMAVGAAGR